jgi:hypothetical protein
VGGGRPDADTLAVQPQRPHPPLPYGGAPHPPLPPGGFADVGSLYRTAIGIAWRDAGLRRIAAWTLLGWVVVYALAFGGTLEVLGNSHRSLRLSVATAVAAWPVAVLSTLGAVVLTLVADAAMDGRRLTVREALAQLRPRRREILLYALLVAGLSRLLAILQERVPLAGHAVLVFDVASSLVTMLAIPVLALEGGSPRHVIGRAGKLVRARLGDAVTGSLSLGFVMIAPAMLALSVIVYGAIAGSALVTAAGGGLMACCLWLTFLVATLFCLALYRDEAGRAPSSMGFSAGQLATGVRKRHSRWW